MRSYSRHTHASRHARLPQYSYKHKWHTYIIVHIELHIIQFYTHHLLKHHQEPQTFQCDVNRFTFIMCRPRFCGKLATDAHQQNHSNNLFCLCWVRKFMQLANNFLSRYFSDARFRIPGSSFTVCFFLSLSLPCYPAATIFVLRFSILLSASFVFAANHQCKCVTYTEHTIV